MVDAAYWSTPGGIFAGASDLARAFAGLPGDIRRADREDRLLQMQEEAAARALADRVYQRQRDAQAYQDSRADRYQDQAMRRANMGLAAAQAADELALRRDASEAAAAFRKDEVDIKRQQVTNERWKTIADAASRAFQKAFGSDSADWRLIRDHKGRPLGWHNQRTNDFKPFEQATPGGQAGAAAVDAQAPGDVAPTPVASDETVGAAPSAASDSFMQSVNNAADMTFNTGVALSPLAAKPSTAKQMTDALSRYMPGTQGVVKYIPGVGLGVQAAQGTSNAIADQRPMGTTGGLIGTAGNVALSTVAPQIGVPMAVASTIAEPLVNDVSGGPGSAYERALYDDYVTTASSYLNTGSLPVPAGMHLTDQASNVKRDLADRVTHGILLSTGLSASDIDGIPEMKRFRAEINEAIMNDRPVLARHLAEAVKRHYTTPAQRRLDEAAAMEQSEAASTLDDKDPVVSDESGRRRSQLTPAELQVLDAGGAFE
jgi:hypothetical protein